MCLSFIHRATQSAFIPRKYLCFFRIWTRPVHRAPSATATCACLRRTFSECPPSTCSYWRGTPGGGTNSSRTSRRYNPRQTNCADVNISNKCLIVMMRLERLWNSNMAGCHINTKFCEGFFTFKTPQGPSLGCSSSRVLLFPLILTIPLERLSRQRHNTQTCVSTIRLY